MPRLTPAQLQSGIPRGGFAGLTDPARVTMPGRAGAELAQDVMDLAGKLDQQRARDETNRGLLAGMEAFGQIEDELLRDNTIDPAERIRRFKERVPEATTGIVENLKHPKAVEAVRVNLGAIGERQLRRMRRDALEDERAASRVTLEQLRIQYGNKAANAETSRDLDMWLALYGRAVLDDQFLEKHEKEKLISEFPALVLETKARKMLQDDPWTFVAMTDAGEFMEIPGPVRESFIASAKRDIERRESEARTAEKNARLERERESAIGFVQRIHDPEHPDGPPTVQDVLDSPLPHGLMEHFINVIEDQAAGKGIDYLDVEVYNDVWERVNLPGHPREIFHENELLPFVLNGIPVKEWNALRGDLQRKLEPAQKFKEQQWAEFFRAYKPSITGSNQFISDPKGDTNWFAFQQEVSFLREQYRAQGKNEMDLIRVGSPDFLGKLAESPPYARTFQEILEDQVRMLEGPGPSGATEPPGGALDIERGMIRGTGPQPDMGESAFDFLQRTDEEWKALREQNR